MELFQSDTTRVILFLMVDDTDHLTGKAGLSPVVTISKNGGPFSTPVGSITEMANGWYKLTPTAADVNTLGPLALHATGIDADPVDDLHEVIIARVAANIETVNGVTIGGAGTVLSPFGPA